MNGASGPRQPGAPGAEAGPPLPEMAGRVPGRTAKPRRWRLAQADPASAEALAQALGVPVLMASLLLRRGCETPDAARAFLDTPLTALHDPRRMAGMEVAVDRLRAAVARHEPIFVCGDYDVDGVTGTALLVQGLQRAGGEVDYQVPRRLEHGYGLHPSIVESAAARGARILVTVDHGIAAHEAVALARARGMDVIVCDHHLPLPVLPSATAILNPRQAGCPYPFKDLCGAGIAFKLLQALYGPGAGEEVWPFLDLVALGTIADLVPLLGENRILVRSGLRELARSLAGGRPGLRALAEVAGVSIADSKPVGVGQVAFGLAPRINAAGRLDDAASGIRLLLTRDLSEARELATKLDQQNSERQDIEEAILVDALARAQSEQDLRRDRAIVLASPTWHPGVIGIVASRLVERLGRPTALIGIQGAEARGSARSAAGWHIADALGRCGDLLLQYGGHRAAAGFSIRPDHIAAFRARFLALAVQDLTEDDLTPTLTVDAEVSLDGLDLDVANTLARLGPHGVGNPEPVLVAREVQVMQTARRVGRNHLKMKVRQSVRSDHVIDAIGFDLGSLVEPLSRPSVPRIDLAFLPERNVWNGREMLQLRVKDVAILDDDRNKTAGE